MNEYLALAIVYFLFIALSYIVYIVAIRLKGLWLGGFTLVYFFSTYFLFEAINHLHQYLRENKILNINFGHASLDLMLLLLFCYLNTLLVIFFILYKKHKTRKSL